MKIAVELSEKTIDQLKEKQKAYNDQTGKNASLDQFIEMVLIEGMMNEAKRKIGSAVRNMKAELTGKRRKATNKDNIEFS